MSAGLPITVVIPAYNRAHMLKSALDSAWSQVPAPPAEVIVVDDGSEDETATLATSLGARVIRHRRNEGLAAARNTGLREASCSWVALLDSDDEWLPHHLSHLWELRDHHALVASSSLRCGADPTLDRIHGPATRSPKVLHSAKELIHPGNIIPVSAAMVQRDIAIQAGGFIARRGVVEDFDLWLRILERGTAICSPRVSILYRMHDEQMSTQDARGMQLAHLEACAAHIQRTGGSRTPLRRFEAVAAWDNMRAALKDKRRRTALRWASVVLSHPQRLLGALMLVLNRLALRRRTDRVSRNGCPSVALLRAEQHIRHLVLEDVEGVRFRDLSDIPMWRAVPALVRRPAGWVVVSSSFQRAFLRALGMRPLVAEQAVAKLVESRLGNPRGCL